jgi:phage repressor protein C with HTH and peptisase S24 domain
MYPRYFSGEYVIVDTTKQVCNNDDVVVKLHDGAVMVKKYKQISGMVFLESYNSSVEPIPVLDGDMVCCYKVVCRK